MRRGDEREIRVRVTKNKRKEHTNKILSSSSFRVLVLLGLAVNFDRISCSLVRGLSYFLLEITPISPAIGVQSFQSPYITLSLNLLTESWSTNSFAAEIGSSSNQIFITDLKPLSLYTVRVLAVNPLGESDPSQTLTIKTEEEGTNRHRKFRHELPFRSSLPPGSPFTANFRSLTPYDQSISSSSHFLPDHYFTITSTFCPV